MPERHATTSADNMQNRPCLVLMFKSPQRSKRRLAAEIGAHAATAAQHLLECAVADVTAWRGRGCLAPAAAVDAEFAREHGYTADIELLQTSGNLGERIAAVNAALLEAGETRQLFIGIDCPALDAAYFDRAAAALRDADVVLGPASDGGVVLMGISGRWPPLAELPWSSERLCEALQRACQAAHLCVATLETLTDVDAAADLRNLPAVLCEDRRLTRRRLCDWIVSEPAI